MENRIKIEELILSLGKFDEKYYSQKSREKNSTECVFLVKPEVLLEKKGFKNRGAFKGVSIDYINIEQERIKYKEKNNVFNMWVRGEIPGSIVVTNSAGFTSNLLTNETFFGCSF